MKKLTFNITIVFIMLVACCYGQSEIVKSKQQKAFEMFEGHWLLQDKNTISHIQIKDSVWSYIDETDTVDYKYKLLKLMNEETLKTENVVWLCKRCIDFGKGEILPEDEVLIFSILNFTDSEFTLLDFVDRTSNTLRYVRQSPR